jgi:hypothetical protein
MGRTLSAGTLAATLLHNSQVMHLLELAFSGGTVRFTTGPNDVSWNSVTWYASYGAMSFAAVSETPDPSGQRLSLTLDGVNLTAITAFLAESYVGRLGTLYRAHISTTTGLIIADPVVLFLGYMNSPWEVSEDWENGWCKVETELVSPLAMLAQVRGITADANSHQAVSPGDTFFTHIATKPQGDFGWGSPKNNTVPARFG